MPYEISATLEGDRAGLCISPYEEDVIVKLREAGLAGVVQITEVLIPRPELIYRYNNDNLSIEKMDEEKQKALNRLLSVGELALVRTETVPKALATIPEKMDEHRLHSRVARAQRVFTFLRTRAI